MKGLWKVIAKFNYKDKYIDYACDIRVRKFAMKIKNCPDCMPQRDIHYDWVRCPYCESKNLREGVKFMYCAYVPQVDEYLNTLLILQRYTAGSWRPTMFKRKFSWNPADNKIPIGKVKPIFYGSSLKEIYYKLKIWDFSKDAPSFHKRRKASASLKLFKVTEEDVENCYKISQNNRLLREL